MGRCIKFVRTGVEAIAPLALGCVLTAASLSKIASFQPFATTISRLSIVPVRLAPAAAAALIVLECMTGLLLLARKSVRVAASGALALFVGFTLVLSAAIIRGVDLPCNCFGTFGPELPMRGQAALDLLCSVLAFTLVRTVPPVHVSVWRSPGFAGGTASAAILWGILLVAWPQPDSAAGRVSANTPAPFVVTFPDTLGRPAVLLLADFDDFTCQLCLDDFLAFCDSLNTERIRRAVDVRLIVRRDSVRSAEAQIRMLEGWTSGNSYLFPVSLDSANLFERSGVGKTSAIVLASDGRLVDIAHFPAGSAKRNEILRAIID